MRMHANMVTDPKLVGRGNDVPKTRVVCSGAAAIHVPSRVGRLLFVITRFARLRSKDDISRGLLHNP